jgi:putative membrane protein
MRFHTITLAVALALGSGWAAAQASGGAGSSVTGGKAAPAAQADGSKLSRGDRKFIENAAADGMYEVQSGQLAASKAQSPDVKGLATKIVNDHEQANNELVQLANSKHVQLPAGPPREKRHEFEKLGKQGGGEFDKQFVKATVQDHEKDIKEFEKAAGKVKDPELKAWVEKTLPQLREHLAMAQKLQGGNPAAMGNR